MTDYLLLSQAKVSMGTATSDANFALRIRGLITDASRFIELAANRRRFDHRLETRRFDARSVSLGGDVDGYSLLLDADLQSASSVTNGDQTVLTPDQYVLMPENAPAADTVELMDVNVAWTWTATIRPIRAIAVAGIWGWGGEWANSGRTLSGGVDASTTSFPVSATTGLEHRMILRADSEYLLVDADVSSSPITVARAQNGSIAASHNSGTPLYYFRPYEVVKRLTQRLVSWMNEHDDNPIFGIVQIGDFQQPIDITQMPKDVQGMILHLRRPNRMRAA